PPPPTPTPYPYTTLFRSDFWHDEPSSGHRLRRPNTKTCMPSHTAPLGMSPVSLLSARSGRHDPVAASTPAPTGEANWIVAPASRDRKSTRLNSSHGSISY